jgi:hypothetical protein
MLKKTMLAGVATVAMLTGVNLAHAEVLPGVSDDNSTELVYTGRSGDYNFNHDFPDCALSGALGVTAAPLGGDLQQKQLCHVKAIWYEKVEISSFLASTDPRIDPNSSELPPAVKAEAQRATAMWVPNVADHAMAVIGVRKLMELGMPQLDAAKFITDAQQHGRARAGENLTISHTRLADLQRDERNFFPRPPVQITVKYDD